MQNLTKDFLSPYYKKGDVFPNLLARSTYLSKYCRDNETWTDTIKRVVESNCELDPNVSLKEKQLLFHIFWTMQALPPGRGLWVSGVEGIPADARYNCWYTTIYDYKDWGWIANQLMLGGGVGVGLSEIAALPKVQENPQAIFRVSCDQNHPDVDEVLPDALASQRASAFEVPDSREGWIQALLKTIEHAYEGKSLIVDVSKIRARGALIKTFGGIACGPGPLVSMLRNIWQVIRRAAGRKLTSVDALDVTNLVGKCIKSGNVRRSALIVLGNPSDKAFRDAKKDFEALLSHRHTSNNSIVFEHFSEFDAFDWQSLIEDNIEFGEPGILNLALGRLQDPGAKGVNPCGEQLLWDREACNLAEVFPANFDGSVEPEVIFRLVARYCLRVRLTPLTDPKSNEVAKRNMRIGVGLGGICDFAWDVDRLAQYYRIVRDEANKYAESLRVAKPITVTTVKPSGTISLLCGSSPGIHAPFAPYYIRRTRHADNDPMTQALKDAGVPYEVDKYDSTGHTLCFLFPMKAKHTRVTVQNQTIREQFERQLQVQNYWADNAVSATISFDRDKLDELHACLQSYAPKLKSVSFLANSHAYEQAPYEVIDEARFKELASKIDFSHPLTRGGDFDTNECSSGACPVR